MSLALERNHRHIAQERRPKATNTEVFLEFEGYELVVRGDYQPPERSARDYPGCAEDFDVTEVYLIDSAIDVSDLFDGDALAIAVLAHMAKERVAA